MKKLLVVLFVIGFTSGLCADGFEVKGIINHIDDNAKTISVNNVVFKIMPKTHIKLDDCGIFGTDLDGKFSDLEVGSFVEVEAWPISAVGGVSQNDATYIASEVEQKCVSNRAY